MTATCDISEHGRMEETLHKVSEKYRRLKANIPGMVYVFALYPDGRHAFPYVNEASRDLFDLEPEDLMRDGTLLSGLIHPEDQARRDESILRSVETLQPWRQELRLIVNGEVRWYDSMSRPERQPDGTVLWDGIILEITARKQAEEALYRSERRYRALVENSTDWIWEIDASGRYTYSSPQVEHMLGYKPEEVLGKTPFDLMTDEEAQHLRARVADMILRRDPIVALENRNRHKDGHSVVLETSGVPIFHPDGTLAGYQGIDRDITERKKVEEVVDRRLALDETLVTISARFVHPGDRDEAIRHSLADLGRLIQATRANLFLIGDWGPTYQWYAKRTPPEGDDLKTFSCDSFPWWMTHLHERGVLPIRDITKMPPEARAEREFLERRYISSILVLPVRIKGDLKGFIGLENVDGIKDWSDYDLASLRVAAETIGSALASKQAEQALRQSEALYRSLVTTSPGAITVADMEGRIMMVNPRSLETYGYTDDSEVIGHRIFEWVPPEESDYAARIFAELLTQGQIRHTRMTLLRRSGERFDTEMNGSLVKDAEGQPRLVMLLTTDLCERAQAKTD